MSISDVLHGKGHQVVKVRTTDTVKRPCASWRMNASARWSSRINGCAMPASSRSVISSMPWPNMGRRR